MMPTWTLDPRRPGEDIGLAGPAPGRETGHREEDFRREVFRLGERADVIDRHRQVRRGTITAIRGGDKRTLCKQSDWETASVTVHFDDGALVELFAGQGLRFRRCRT